MAWKLLGVLLTIITGFLIPSYFQHQGDISQSHLQNLLVTIETQQSHLQSSLATIETERSSPGVAPILDGAEMLIPPQVAAAGIQKLMMHKETAGSRVISLLTGSP